MTSLFMLVGGLLIGYAAPKCYEEIRHICAVGQLVRMYQYQRQPVYAGRNVISIEDFDRDVYKGRKWGGSAI